jgi:hypothetical protein
MINQVWVVLYFSPDADDDAFEFDHVVAVYDNEEAATSFVESHQVFGINRFYRMYVAELVK